MPATHTLNTKIEALNLLDLHDGNFNLVNSRLGIPIRTLRGWLADEKELRLQYDNRQYRYFGNIKLKLLNHILEFSLDTMNKMMTGDLGGNTLSQLVYVLSTLINQATKLEKSFEVLEPNPQAETEQTNRIRYVYEDDLTADPLPTDEIPEQPVPSQSSGLWAAPAKIGIGADPDPEIGTLETGAPLMDGPELPDDGPNLARPGKPRKRPKKHRRKQKRTLRQSARLRPNRRNKRK